MLVTALHQIGVLSDKDLKTFEKDNSDLAGHPVKNLKMSFTGSLGMGISIAVGLGSFQKKKLKNKVFVIVGDGECNEGSIGVLMTASPLS